MGVVVPEAGFEPADELMQITDSKLVAKPIPTTNTQIDSHESVQGCPVLARVVSAWGGLSPAVRESIATLSEASTE